jgi:hypothetical protein
MHSHLVWYDSRIRTTSGSGIICIFCFDEFFFTDLDPRIRIRVRVTPNSFRKNLNMIFLEEKRIRATFECIRVCFLHFSFKKDAVPGLRIETRIRTVVRIRVSALAPVQ